MDGLLEALILEIVRQDILKRADKATVDRSKPLDSELISMVGNILTFKTRSGTDPTKFWTQKVQISRLAKALEPLWEGRDKKVLPAIQRVLSEDVSVHCNCPAFKWWGFAYISTKDKFKVGGGQKRFPHIRNPNLKGSVCKHLVNVLQVLPFQASKVASMFKREHGL